MPFPEFPNGFFTRKENHNNSQKTDPTRQKGANQKKPNPTLPDPTKITENYHHTPNKNK
jgi:hypothetical protein